MSVFRNPYGPLAIAIIVGFFHFANYFFSGIPFISTGAGYFRTWTTIITVMLFWVGLINVVRFAYRDVAKRTPGRWWLAIYQIALVAVMLISGFGQGQQSVGRASDSLIRWLYDHFLVGAEMSSGAVSGLWCVTAIYRAFRARNFEAFLFLLGGAFVILRNAPIGAMIWAGFPTIGTWIMGAPYTGTFRGLTIGVGIGILAYAFRYYVGKERGAFGVVE
jgi:hypothetical protein